jgi:site-specific DNA-methyltransferase (adenine-specific)
MEPTLYVGNSLDVIAYLPTNSIDSIVTDPPYEIGFMGKGWDDSGIAYNVDLWSECLRVLKPGGFLLSFGGTRTFHRMAEAIKSAGFIYVDTLHWTYGTGFPKSLDIGKALDKAAGAERLPTGVKERSGSRAARGGAELVGSTSIESLKWKEVTTPATPAAEQWSGWGTALKPSHEPIVVAQKPFGAREPECVPVNMAELNTRGHILYFAKANKKERPVVNGVSHATVKPLALMRHLITISTPEGGVVLDPFAGSGTTMEAAVLENRFPIGVELTPEHAPLIKARMERQGIDLEVSE